jgi:ABC-type uncharacterized transport system auxiliary subunit
MKHRLPLLGLLAAVSGLLTSCLLPKPQADPVRYFTLGGLAGTMPAASGAQVRPVQLAGHLRNRALAVRIAEHEVIYLEAVNWAEPLDAALTRILRNRLSDAGRSITVTVEVQRFELVRSAGNSVQLTATYTLQPAEAGKAAAQRGVFTAPAHAWDGKDYGVLIGLMRHAANELGDTLAGALAAAENR